MKKLLMLVSLCFALLPPLAAADSVVDDILDRGELRAGFSSFVPWAMRNKDGEFIGFEIDVAREVAKDMGVELVLVPTAWDGIIPALLAKKFDVIISGMFMTPARNLQINFTIPYDETGLGLVANRELAGDFDSLEDFNSADVTFAVRRGTYPVTYIQETFPLAQLVQLDDDASARQELINGNAHAWVASEPEPTFSALDNPQILFQPISGALGTSHQQAFGLRKSDADALNFFSNWIRTKHQSGWLAERRAYWFESRDWRAQLDE